MYCYTSEIDKKFEKIAKFRKSFQLECLVQEKTGVNEINQKNLQSTLAMKP